MKNLHSFVYTAFDADPAPITAFLQWLARQHDLPAHLHLLDMGCGPGRMLGEYATLGWQVTGMELDPDFYAQAQAAAGELPGAAVKSGGFAQIDDASTYHLIAAVNSPFAYLLTGDEQREALARCYRALVPGGVLFLDVPNLLWFLKHERAPIVRTTEVEGYHVRFLERHEYDFHDARFVQINEYKITVPDGGESFTLNATHTHRITSPPELIDRVTAAGFAQVCTYNGYNARQCERLHGRTILLSARKPGQ